MDVTQLKRGVCATIKKLKAKGVLKARLYSFGIEPGAMLCVEEFGIGKSTVKVRINQATCVALRADEARMIEVEINHG